MIVVYTESAICVKHFPQPWLILKINTLEQIIPVIGTIEIYCIVLQMFIKSVIIICVWISGEEKSLKNITMVWTIRYELQMST